MKRAAFRGRLTSQCRCKRRCLNWNKSDWGFVDCASKTRPLVSDLVGLSTENKGRRGRDADRYLLLADYISAFPAGVNVAATWDKNLAYLRGKAMGEEHRGKGVDVQLGPVAGPLGRHPDGGRNWEGFSPDPVLTGVLMAETIKGIQDAGVIACAKHFIGNEMEHFRQASEAVGYGFDITESVSSNIDDKTLHELYLWPFADAVRGKQSPPPLIGDCTCVFLTRFQSWRWFVHVLLQPG